MTEGAWYPALAFMAYTGARRGWRDVDLVGGTVTIARSLSDTRDGLAFKTPKNGKSRDVERSSSLVAILKSHRAAQAKERLALGSAYADGDLVFALPDGNPIRPSEPVRRSGQNAVE